MRAQSLQPWRELERSRFALAQCLHLAAAKDLAATPETWRFIPTNGTFDDLLAHRTRSEVPSIHLSRAAARLALSAVLIEMARRAFDRPPLWDGDSLEQAMTVLAGCTPSLIATTQSGLARRLPELRKATNRLAPLTDLELARLAGRAFESGQSTLWVFRRSGEEPRRLWDPWKAKRAGAFFTPQPIAERLAQSAIRQHGHVLDPAVGAGALLVEALQVLQRDVSPEKASSLVFGIEVDPSVAELAAAVVGFAADAWRGGAPPLLGTNIVATDTLLFRRDELGSSARLGRIADVLAEGGFHSIVMNPPYGQLKVNATSLPTRAGDDRHARRAREAALADARHRADQLACALRTHPDYRHAHGGVPDLPRFFIERALTMMREDALLACIVPSTLLADHRSRNLRRHLLDDMSVTTIDLIPEDERLFVDVNQPTAILVVRNRPGTRAIKVRAPLDLGSKRSKQGVSITRRLIETLDANGLRIPQCGAEDVRILERIHQNPGLGSLDGILNLRGEFDLTLDRGWLEDQGGLRLVRGDQIERYRTDLPTIKEARVGGAFLTDRISARKRPHVDLPRLIGRQCSYLKKARRLSFALLEPPGVVANSCNYVTVDSSLQGLNLRSSLLFLLALLNSSLIEWRFRLLNSTNHVSNYEIDTLPIPVESGSAGPLLASLASALVTDPTNRDLDEEIDRIVFDLFGLTEREANHVRLSL